MKGSKNIKFKYELGIVLICTEPHFYGHSSESNITLDTRESWSGQKQTFSPVAMFVKFKNTIIDIILFVSLN